MDTFAEIAFGAETLGTYIKEFKDGVNKLADQAEATRDTLLAEQPEADAASATRMLINKLLHEPSRVMREIAETDMGNRVNHIATLEQLLRRLFKLDAKEDRNEK